MKLVLKEKGHRNCKFAVRKMSCIGWTEKKRAVLLKGNTSFVNEHVECNSSQFIALKELASSLSFLSFNRFLSFADTRKLPVQPASPSIF